MQYVGEKRYRKLDEDIEGQTSPLQDQLRNYPSEETVAKLQS